MSGSEQFLGRQLAEQAIQLGNLVTKMNEMVVAQGESIDKYAISSDTEQHIVTNNTAVNNQASIFTNFNLVPYLNGKMKIKISAKTASAGTFSVRFILNGVNVGELSFPYTNGVDVVTKEIILNINEKDTLKLQAGATTVSSANINKITLNYDLISKPNVSYTV